MKANRAALLLLRGLSACGGNRPVGTAEPAALPPSGIDGRYRGIARLIRADTAGCPRSGPRVITVRVTRDGQIHGSDGRGSVDGSISGDHMDLTVTSPICDLRFALTRLP